MDAQQLDTQGPVPALGVGTGTATTDPMHPEAFDEDDAEIPWPTSLKSVTGSDLVLV